MRMVCTSILLTLFLAVSGSSQGEPEVHDEFGATPLGDLSGRLDVFLNELNKAPGRKGFIRIYSSKRGWLAFPHVRKAFYEAYFKARGNANRDFEIELCAGDEDVITRFYFGKPTDVLAPCRKWEPDTSQTKLMKSETFYPTGSSDAYLGTVGVDAAVEKAWLDFTAELLKKFPESRVYIIGYVGRFYVSVNDNETLSRTDSIRVNDRDMNRIKRSIVKRGVEGSRLIVLRGGHRNYFRSAEIWFVPKGGTIPTPSPDRPINSR